MGKKIYDAAYAKRAGRVLLTLLLGMTVLTSTVHAKSLDLTTREAKSLDLIAREAKSLDKSTSDADTAETARTGGIQISVETYTKVKPNGQRVFEPEKNLQPGQNTPYFIEVMNRSMDAYVRVDVAMSPDFCLPKNVLNGVDLSWKYTNGGYYLMRPLMQGESALLCTSVKVPNRTDFGDEGLKISVDACAVQAENFTPDFQKEDPWGGVVAQNVKDCEAGVMEDSVYDTERGISIQAKGEADDFLSKEMILTKKGNLMPGDFIEDEVAFEARKGKQYYFCAKYKGAYPPESNRMKLKISTSDGTNLYEGSLFSKNLKKGIPLGISEKKENVTICCELSMDSEMTNAATWEEIPVSFEIESRKKKKGTNVLEEQDTTTVLSATSLPVAIQEMQKTFAPNTGDERPLLPLLTALVLSAAVLAVLWMKKRRKEKD